MASTTAIRFLGLLGEDAARLSVVRAKVQCLALSSALTLECTMLWLRGAVSPLPSLLAAASACLVSLDVARAGSSVAAIVAMWSVWFHWPTTANHTFALAVGHLLCTWSIWRQVTKSPGPEQLLRWLGFTVLLWSGLQKLLHESYWHGQFLAVKFASAEARWHWLRLLVTRSELEVLAKTRLEDGPFVLDSVAALSASRALPLLEMGLAIGLTWVRGRSAVVLSSLLLIVALQSVAGEMAFAITMCSVFGAFLKLRTSVLLTRVLWVASIAFAIVGYYFPGTLAN